METDRLAPEDNSPEKEPDKLRLAGAVGIEALNPERRAAEAPRAREHLGKVVISAEADETRAALSSIGEARVLSMPRDELLSIAERISVGGSNLRKIFETNLIGEGGLRRLIVRFIRSDEMMPALRGEILEHEKDFERDPAMRDLALNQEISQHSQDLLAELMASDPDIDMAAPKNEPKQAKRGGVKAKLPGKPKRLGALDKILAFIIVALIVVVILVILLKH